MRCYPKQPRACRSTPTPSPPGPALLVLPSTAGAGDVYEFISLIVCILPRARPTRIQCQPSPFSCPFYLRAPGPAPQLSIECTKVKTCRPYQLHRTTVCPSVRVLPPPLCHGSSRPPPRLFSQLLNLKSRIPVCCDSLGPWPCFAPSARVYTTRAITHSRTGSQQYGQIFMLAAQRLHAS